MNELWKPIPGYEGIYEASNLGRIRTAPGKTTANARYNVRVWKSRVLKPKRGICKKRQDLRVSLWKDGAVKYHLVSRLVAAAWIGTPEPGMTVNHINGIWLDNSVENLEWVSLSENIKKGFETGLYAATCCPITLIAESGDALCFRSQAMASRFLGRNEKYINNQLRAGRRLACDANGVEYIIREGATA